MCPRTKNSLLYRRLAQLYGKLSPNESKSKQLAQVDFIWSKVEGDENKIKTVLQLMHSESQLPASCRTEHAADNQLKKLRAELYKILADDGVIHHKKNETTAKTTIGDVYRCGDLLGSGGYGSVYSGTRISDGLPVAIKIVTKTKISNWKSYNGQSVPMEAYLNLQLGSVDGAVKMLDYYEMSSTCVFVFERPAECMDLFDYITKEKRLSEPIARRFLIQLIHTLVDCQSCGVIHRDIKDENLIIDLLRNEVKLIDFGSGSTVEDEKYMDFSGTRIYAPPEFIREGWYFGEALTVWSLGILLFNMVTGNVPFHGDDQILAGDIKFKTEVSGHCQFLIRWCLSPVHTDRPTLSQVLQHPWINLPSHC